MVSGRTPVGALLSRYMDRDLTKSEHERVEEALARDPELREELRRMQAMRTLLRQEMTVDEPPEDLMERLSAIGRPEEPPDVPIELLVQASRSAQLDVAGRSKRTKRRKRRKS